MQRARKIGVTLKNNWKKSVFLGLASGYGLNWYAKRLSDDEYMRGLAREALGYGNSLQGVQAPSYAVTVILNPVASGGKGRKLYEKYCAPLLHLAGMKVSVVRTESEGQAKDIMQIMEDADAVLVAGGDGVLLEAVTGLLRRDDADQVASKIPIGILPVGKTNTMAAKLVEGTGGNQVKLMGEATMTVVRQLRKPVGVLEMENLGEERRGQKVYGVNGIRTGAWMDAERRVNKYWLTGPLKQYLTYLGSYLTGYKEVFWTCDLGLKYTQSESGRSSESRAGQGRVGQGWFQWLSSGSQEGRDRKADYEEVRWTSWPDRFRGSEVSIEPGEGSGLMVRLFRGDVGLGDFVGHGASLVRRSKEGLVDCDTLVTDSVVMEPGEGARLLSLDGEDIEFENPVKVTFLRDKISMFCSDKSAYAAVPAASPSSAVGRWSAVSSLTSRKL